MESNAVDAALFATPSLGIVEKWSIRPDMMFLVVLSGILSSFVNVPLVLGR